MEILSRKQDSGDIKINELAGFINEKEGERDIFLNHMKNHIGLFLHYGDYFDFPSDFNFIKCINFTIGDQRMKILLLNLNNAKLMLFSDYMLQIEAVIKDGESHENSQEYDSGYMCLSEEIEGPKYEDGITLNLTSEDRVERRIKCTQLEKEGFYVFYKGKFDMNNRLSHTLHLDMNQEQRNLCIEKVYHPTSPEILIFISNPKKYKRIMKYTHLITTEMHVYNEKNNRWGVILTMSLPDIRDLEVGGEQITPLDVNKFPKKRKIIHLVHK